jgi:hypothetical protein
MVWFYAFMLCVAQGLCKLFNLQSPRAAFFHRL